MPIANCYIQIEVSKQQLETLTKDWAQTIEVDLKDICLSFVNIHAQTGQNYKVMVNLFLPTLWEAKSREKIQLSLDTLLKKHLELEDEDVFIITSLVQSGNVVENGQIIRWDKN
jgi:hypothetical protein